jgi:hypothetical protein
MKRFAMLVLLAGAVLSSGGCLGTPGYTGTERNRQIGRAWSYEGGQIVDDFDYVMMLRPPSKLTTWNVR